MSELQQFHVQLLPSEDVPVSVINSLKGQNCAFMVSGPNIYIRSGHQYYSCDMSPLSYSFLHASGRFREISLQAGSISGFLERLIQDPDYHPDTADFTEFHLPDFGGCWSLIVFRPYHQASSVKAASADFSFLPVRKQEILLTPGNGEVILVYQSDGLDREDLTDYSKALIETMETETGIRFLAGIGNSTANILNIGKCYNEAVSAIMTARAFGAEGSVFRFADLALEKFLSGLPSRTRASFSAVSFPNAMEAIIHGNLLETIRVFFRNDLSLTTTSRDLFIHRNTLSYRLEKVRDLTGLDIRNFRDATVLYILMLMHELEINEGKGTEK